MGEGISFAVKTQELSAEKRYGRSWVFEKTDKEIFEKKDPSLYVVLTSLDLQQNLFYIRGIVQVGFLHSENLFQPMRKANLITKRAVYGEGLEGKELMQLPSLKKPSSSKSFLRYPGGKGKMLEMIMPEIEKRIKGSFVDGFIGGGSVLLEVAQKYPYIKLYGNDADPWIASLWKVVVRGGQDLESLIEKVKTAVPTVPLFYQMKECQPVGEIEEAYWGLFFNRTCFSGIRMSGCIGGKGQLGKYKIDCRYNSGKLEQAMRNCHNLLRGRTEIECCDIMKYKKLWEGNDAAYLDPPYAIKGKELYPIYMKIEEHKNLAKKLFGRGNFVLSIDNCPEIYEMYGDWAKIIPLETRYSVSGEKKNWKEGKELLIWK